MSIQSEKQKEKVESSSKQTSTPSGTSLSGTSLSGTPLSGSPSSEALGKKKDARAKRESPLRLVLVLTMVCAVAAAALAGVNELTKKPIERARYRFKLASVNKVLPECDNDPGKETVKITGPGGEKITVYRCLKGGEVVAVAYSVDTEKNKNPPYSGVIEVLVGVSQEGRIVTSPKDKVVGVSILNHSETPGLGAQITGDAFLRSFADQNFVGRNLSKGTQSCGHQGDCRKWAVRKDDPGGFVDVISGATISTRAVTEAVQRALAVFNSKKEEMFRDE